MSLDIAKIEALRTDLFAKTRIKIEADDPVFAIIALNQEVIEDGVKRLGDMLDSANKQFAEIASTVTKQKKIEINNAAAEAVAGTLKKELSGLQAAVVQASNQLAANRSETRKWVISVSVISSTFGGFLGLLLARWMHII